MRAFPNIENCLFIGVLLLFIALLVVEKRRPFAKTPNSRLRESFSTNTSAFLLNNVVMGLLSVSSLLVVAENYAGYGLLSGMSDGPLKWLASFVLFDFAVYLWHYLGHQNEFLWRFHKVHHSDKSFNVSTGLRFHVADQLMEVGFKCLCTIVIGVPAKVVVICEIVRMAFVLFHHANVEFAWDKALSWVFITPSLHRTHHSTRRSEHDSNYGIVLSIWDRIFGTRKELAPKHIGLEMIEADNLLQLFSLAFVTERRLARVLHLVPRRRERPDR
jgi:sterol desaturase/sphingolipid hydroxylase (fatty acid hydroxylase superfamily)